MMSLEPFITRLTTAPPAGCSIHSHLTLPAHASATVALPASYPPWLLAQLHAQGIERLAAFQSDALQHWQQGPHLCVSAPSGGGRGLVRLLALYTALSTEKETHALLLFPHQSREHAQLVTLTAWNETLSPAYRLSAAIYDGSTPHTQRRALRQSPPRMLLTTPEMLHAGILAYHSGWRAFFQNLRIVVLVDAHLCAGTLGAHMTHLLARLQRISSHYGSQPQYLMTTAPVANLHEVARLLLGHPCSVVIGESFFRHPQSRILVKTSYNVHNAQGDMITVLRALFADLQGIDAPPLVLVPPETIWDGPLHALEAEGAVTICQGPVSREAYQRAAHSLQQGVGRALVLPHDTPTATIRPTSMRSIVFLGLPSSLTLLHDYLSLFASTQPHSLSLLLLTDTTPLERYVLRYPAVYQTHWSQAPGVYPSNPQVTQQHLLCAAAELALGAGEPYVKQPGMAQRIEQLVADQTLVRRTATGDWIAAQRQVHRRVRLRAYEPLFAVVHELDGQLLTRVRPGQAFRDYFEGATFTHGQQPFHVERLLTDRHRILVRPRHTTSVTRGLISSHIAEQRLEASFSKETFCLSTGGLSIVETLQGYEHLDTQTYRRISVHRLPAQHRQLRTQATWLDFLIPAGSLHFSARTAVHTFIHAILAGLPLLWLADNIPHAGVLLDHENTENIPGVVLFDESAGGNGVSAFLYHTHTQVWRLGLQMLLQCDCAHGCFHCITGYTCGVCAQEVPLNRQAGIALFQRLLGEVAPALEQVRLPDLPAAVLSQETRRPRHLYLCLTTQKSADEVGGWQHKHLLGLGVAVTYDTQDERYRVYTAETVEDLLASLRLADLVIGFNARDFDYQVLQPYTTASLAALPTLAILDDVQEELGYRLSFTHLVQETLGINRPDESLHTLQWFRQGERNRIVEHCRRDITHLRALVRHGAHTGHVWYRDRTDARQAFAVNWQFAEHDG